MSSNKYGDYQLIVDSSGQPILIGVGATSRVYRALHGFTNAEVALKVFDDVGFGRGQAEACRRLIEKSPPNHPRMHPSGITPEGVFYIPMELVEGVSVAQRLTQSGPLPWEEAFRIGIQIAQGLEDLLPEYHADLKLEDILIENGDAQRIVLLDAGGFVRGTAAHAPPEQLTDDHPRASAAADAYALGSCLWEMICGRPPFESKTAGLSIQELANLKRAGCAVGLLPVPPLARSVLEKLLAPEPGDRPQSPSEVKAMLKAALITSSYPSIPKSGDPGIDPDRLTGKPRTLLKVAQGYTLYEVEGAGPATHPYCLVQIDLPTAQDRGAPETSERALRQEIAEIMSDRLLGISEILRFTEDSDSIRIITDQWLPEQSLWALMKPAQRMPGPESRLSHGGADLFLALARLVDECEKRGWRSPCFSSTVIRLTLPGVRSTETWFDKDATFLVPPGNPGPFMPSGSRVEAAGPTIKVRQLKDPLHRQFAALLYEFIGGRPSDFLNPDLKYTPIIPQDVSNGPAFDLLMRAAHAGSRSMKAGCESWMLEIAALVKRRRPIAVPPPRPPDPELVPSSHGSGLVLPSGDVFSPPSLPIQPASPAQPTTPPLSEAPPSNSPPPSPPPSLLPPPTEAPPVPARPPQTAPVFMPSRPASSQEPTDRPADPFPFSTSKNQGKFAVLAASTAAILLLGYWFFINQNPAPTPGGLSIDGKVTADRTGDGVEDGPVTNAAVELYDHASGRKAGATVTDSAGAYRFDGLAPSLYRVSLTLPTQHSVIVDPDGGGDPAIAGDNHPIDIAGGFGRSMVNFLLKDDRGQPTGNPALPLPPDPPQSSPPTPALGSISGRVAMDNDDDGTAETGLGGVRLELNPSPPGVRQRLTTNTDGRFSFDSLPPDDYVVRVLNPPPHDGVLAGSGDGADPDVIGDGSPIRVTAGSAATDQDFHYKPPAPTIPNHELTELKRLLRCSSKVDWDEGLIRSVGLAESVASGSVPQELKLLADLFCLQLESIHNDPHWALENMLQKAADGPLQSPLAHLLLARQQTRRAEDELRSGNTDSANTLYGSAIQRLQSGTDLGHPLCQLHLGFLLTVATEGIRLQYPNLSLPSLHGRQNQGFSLLNQAYQELAGDTLQRRYGDRALDLPGNQDIRSKSRSYEAAANLRLGQCWESGLGTGFPRFPTSRRISSMAPGERHSFQTAVSHFNAAIERKPDYTEALRHWVLAQFNASGGVPSDHTREGKLFHGRLKKAVELNDPDCMVLEAERLWGTQKKPDRQRAVEYMRRAAQTQGNAAGYATDWLKRNAGAANR
jgi:serine/threonine protein kinase